MKVIVIESPTGNVANIKVQCTTGEHLLVRTFLLIDEFPCNEIHSTAPEMETHY